jgi:hypothetical protein
MKYFNKFILGLALVASLFLGVGCATGPQINPALEQAGITTAAAVGTQIAITPPTGNAANIPYFKAGESALNVLSGETNQLSIADITAALDKAIGNNQYANLIAPLVLNILNADLQNTGTNSVVQNQQLRDACGWIATGIGEGLGNANLPPASVALKLSLVKPNKK